MTQRQTVGHFARRHAMAAALATAGTLHFVRPRFFDSMIPPKLPGSPRTWTLGSGVAELTEAAYRQAMGLDPRRGTVPGSTDGAAARD